jgi:hypothetical protein
MVEPNEGMSILRRAEGYCLHKALSARWDVELKDYLDAANLLNYLWRRMHENRRPCVILWASEVSE